jgi:hypothetical protein
VRAEQYRAAEVSNSLAIFFRGEKWKLFRFRFVALEGSAHHAASLVSLKKEPSMRLIGRTCLAAGAVTALALSAASAESWRGYADNGRWPTEGGSQSVKENTMTSKKMRLPTLATLFLAGSVGLALAQAGGGGAGGRASGAGGTGGMSSGSGQGGAMGPGTPGSANTNTLNNGNLNNNSTLNNRPCGSASGSATLGGTGTTGSLGATGTTGSGSTATGQSSTTLNNNATTGNPTTGTFQSAPSGSAGGGVGAATGC